MLRKENEVNPFSGLGIPNGQAGVRFEDNVRYKERCAKDCCRRDKSSNLLLIVKAIVAASEGEKRPGLGFGEEIPATHNAQHEEQQGGDNLFEVHVQYLSDIYNKNGLIKICRFYIHVKQRLIFATFSIIFPDK